MSNPRVANLACHWRWLLVPSIFLIGQTGCRTAAEVRIIQAGLRPPQDEVALRSGWAYVADDAPGLERILLMFPLPGARAGDRQFFIYLRVPGRQSKPVHVGDPLPEGGRVCGFLIQATGQLAGKTVFEKGKIQLQGVPFDGGYRRQGRITLYGADGSMVDGRFVAVVDSLEVIDFEDDKAGDVRALIQTDLPADTKQPDLGPRSEGSRP